MDFAVRRVKGLGVPVGTIAVTPEQARHYADIGVSFLAMGADQGVPRKRRGQDAGAVQKPG